MMRRIGLSGILLLSACSNVPTERESNQVLERTASLSEEADIGTVNGSSPTVSPYMKGLIENEAEHCRVVITEQEFVALRDKGKEPETNRVMLSKTGEIRFNSVIVSEDTLRQFLEQAGHMNPAPRLILVLDPEASAESVYRIKEAMVQGGSC